MRRNRRQIARSRERAARRMASRETLERRARQQARKTIERRLSQGKSRSEMSVPEREALERKMKGRSDAIDRLARRLLPQVTKAERERLAKQRSSGSDDDSGSQTESNTSAVTEQVSPNPKQIKMVMTQLNFMANAVVELIDCLEDSDSVPEWFQNKMTKAHAEIESMHSYMIGKRDSDEGMCGTYVAEMLPEENSVCKERNDIMIQLSSALDSGDERTRIYFEEDSALFDKEQCQTIIEAHDDISDIVLRKKFRKIVSESYINMLKASLELSEKLSAKDSMGDWIRDFYKSDAPQFKGADKEKRRQMAIAAKLSADEKQEES